MQLDTDLIRTLIASWKISASTEEFQKIKELLDSYIYFFPKMAYRASSDYCSDFYLFVEAQIASILRSYPLDSPYHFTSWFNQVLLFKYADFSKQSPDFFIANMLPLDRAIAETDDSIQAENLDDILSAGERALLIFCENPSEFCPKNMVELSLFCGREISCILEYYGKICAFHEHRHERLAYETFTAGRIQESLSRLRRRIQKSPPDKKEALLIKAARLENRLQRLQSLRHLEDRQIQKIIAEMIGCPKKSRRILIRINQKRQYSKTKQENHAPL